MLILLATREMRRIPALLLVSCLLTMGVRVASSPVRDGANDGMSAHASSAHAQVVRALGLRPATVAGHAPVAAVATRNLFPQEWVVRESGEYGVPVVALRSVPQPFHQSRAPPVSS